MLSQEEHCRLSIGFLLLLFLSYLFIYFTILFTLLSVCVLCWSGQGVKARLVKGEEERGTEKEKGG